MLFWLNHRVNGPSNLQMAFDWFSKICSTNGDKILIIAHLLINHHYRGLGGISVGLKHGLILNCRIYTLVLRFYVRILNGMHFAVAHKYFSVFNGFEIMRVEQVFVQQLSWDTSAPRRSIISTMVSRSSNDIPETI